MATEINTVVVSIGSNLTPRWKRVEEARKWISDVLEDTCCSEIYETPEIHGIGRPYMNMVVCGHTTMDMDCFNRALKKYELLMGRDTNARQRGDVPIDLDIVIWNEIVVRNKDFNQQFFQLGFRQIGEMPLQYAESVAIMK